jgi:osmoprotectant transport system permease protein
MSMAAEIWDAFNDPILDGPGETVTHIQMSVVALTAATGVGVVAGVAAAKLGRVASFLVIAIGNLGRTVPTFAVMALVVALSSIGFWPAVIGLILLGIPPILLNAYTGVREVDPDTVEAARGMGLTPVQLLARVELPVAVPLMFAGIRISAVQIVATAALAGLVGAGGLGVLVLSGLANNDTAVLLAGAIPIALLAVATEMLFSTLSRLLTPKGLRLARASTTI